MKAKWYNNFSEWRIGQVERVFQLQRNDEIPDFKQWLEPRIEIDPYTDERLNALRLELQRFVSAWNEYELFGRFIGPLLSLISFWGRTYNLFHNRTLSLRLSDDRKTSGQLDGMVASGIEEPEQPYFFIHEYKRNLNAEGDPQGQLLIAMLAAQHLTTDGGPLYGCYVIGPFWRFVYLDGTTFAESQGYDATDGGELHIIWNILHETKRRIEARVALLED
jgi:hypothetical protein